MVCGGSAVPHSRRVLIKSTSAITHEHIMTLTFLESDASGNEDDSAVIKQTVKGPNFVLP